MDAARQVIRWSIPGSVFLLVLGILQLTSGLVVTRSLERVATGTIMTAPAVAMVTLASVPLGFLLYQGYFFIYGHLRYRYLVNFDRGTDILTRLDDAFVTRIASRLHVPLDLESMTENWFPMETLFPALSNAFPRLRQRFPLIMLQEAHRSSSGAGRYIERQRNNWHLVRCILDEQARESTIVKSEFTTISDIYHALGAVRVATTFALATFLTYNVFDNHSVLQEQPGWTAAALVLSLALVLALRLVLRRARWSTLHVAQDTLAHGLAIYSYSDAGRQLLERRSSPERRSATTERRRGGSARHEIERRRADRRTHARRSNDQLLHGA